MQLSIHNHVLLRGILAGAVALAGATACSRSDQTYAARDSTQSGAIDTSVVTADTGAASTSQARTADTGNSAVTSKPKAPNARIHPGTDSAAQGADRGAAGYREMGRDTASPSESNPSDTSHIQPTPDSGVSAAPTADTAAASNSSVASTETSNPPADADTLDIQVQADTTTAQAGVRR